MEGPVDPNPFAAPEVPIGDSPGPGPSDLSEVEAIRRAHLDREAKVQLIGLLTLLAGLFVLFATAAAVVAQGPRSVPRPAVAVILIALLGTLGIGLLRLRPWARWTAAGCFGLSTLHWSGLMAFRASARWQVADLGAILGAVVVGVLIFVHVLTLLLSAEGGVVFSRGYKDVIAATPHVEGKRRSMAKGCLSILGMWLIAGAAFGTVRHLLR